MAITAATVWEVQTGGSATNGGGFDPAFGGVDYSQSTTPIATGTASSSGTTLTATTGIFTAQMVGNMVTNGTQWAQITAFTSSTVVTIDSSPAWTTQSIAVGGALARPDTILGTSPIAVAGNTVYIQSGTYTLTTTYTIGADGSLAGRIKIIGYPSGGSRADQDIAEASMPVITSATNSLALFTFNAANRVMLRNLKLTHTAGTRGSGLVNVTSQSIDISVINCVFDGCLTAVVMGSSSVTSFTPFTITGSTIRNCTSTAMSGSVNNQICSVDSCYFSANASVGISLFTTTSTGGTLDVFGSVFNGCGGDAIQIGVTTGVNIGTSRIDSNTFYNTTGSGIHLKTTSGEMRGLLIKNNVFVSNSRYGIECDTSSVNECTIQLSNAFYNNTLAARLNLAAGYGDITLTGSPFTNAGSGDFSLNNTASAGTALRGTAYLSAVGANGATTSNYLDVGASQVQLTASVGASTGMIYALGQS